MSNQNNTGAENGDGASYEVTVEHMDWNDVDNMSKMISKAEDAIKRGMRYMPVNDPSDRFGSNTAQAIFSDKCKVLSEHMSSIIIRFIIRCVFPGGDNVQFTVAEFQELTASMRQCIIPRGELDFNKFGVRSKNRSIDVFTGKRADAFKEMPKNAYSAGAYGVYDALDEFMGITAPVHKPRANRTAQQETGPQDGPTATNRRTARESKVRAGTSERFLCFIMAFVRLCEMKDAEDLTPVRLALYAVRYYSDNAPAEFGPLFPVIRPTAVAMYICGKPGKTGNPEQYPGITVPKDVADAMRAARDARQQRVTAASRAPKRGAAAMEDAAEPAAEPEAAECDRELTDAAHALLALLKGEPAK